MTKILIVGSDAIGKNMAGPGIRSYEIAKVLSKEHEVYIAVQNIEDLKPFGPEIILKDDEMLAYYLKKCDILMVQGFLLEQYPILKKAKVPMIVDLYDPFIFEGLQLDKKLPMTERLKRHNFNLKMFADQLIAGDYFITANEEQRDYWIGMLSVYNRINPWTYESDKTLYNLIDVVPFGIPEEEPKHRKRVLKGVYNNIKENDKVILWGGGIWNWFDPVTLVITMDLICKERQDIKLFFMGTKRPDAPDDIADEASHFRMMERNAREFCKVKGILDSFVFFNEWTPFFERENYLIEADIGISLHIKTIEAEFANRTRILDYIWAKLPIITTKGDPLSKLVEEKELGYTIEPQDPEQLKEAIYTIIDYETNRDKIKNNLAQIGPQFYWKNVTLPLQNFCANPKYASDKPASISKNRSDIEISLNKKAENNRLIIESIEDEFSKTANEIGFVMDDYFKKNKELVIKISELEENLRVTQAKLSSLESNPAVRALKKAKNIFKGSSKRRRPRSNKEVIGEIFGTKSVRQVFKCPEDRLTAISIMFATYNRYNDCDLIFKLFDSAKPNKEIVEIKMNANHIKDNTYNDFKFKPIINSKNRTMLFLLSSPTSLPGNALTVWYNPLSTNTENRLFYEGTLIAGEIYFSPIYES
jgi:glycosyltransferase involved in cell wall biosynthesis